MKFSYILAAIFLFVLAIFFSNKFISTIQAKTATTSQYSTKESPHFVTWEQAQSSDKPIAIEFYAEWCGYCKRFAPILEQLSSQYSDKYNFIRIDAENSKNRELVKAFEVNSYPSFYLFDPKSKKCAFVEQSIYSRPDLVKKELDNFYNAATSSNSQSRQ